MNTSIKIQGSAALLLFGLGLFTSVFSGCGAPVKPAILKCNCACNNSSYKAHTDDYERFSSECKTWCADFGVPGSAQTCFESDVPGGAGGTAGTAGTGAAGKTGTGGAGGAGRARTRAECHAKRSSDARRSARGILSYPALVHLTEGGPLTPP